MKMVQFIITILIILALVFGMILLCSYSIQRRAAKDVIALEDDGLKIVKCSLRACLLEGNGRFAGVEAHWASAFFPPRSREASYYGKENITKYHIIYKPKKLMLDIPPEIIKKHDGNLPPYEELLKNKTVPTTPMITYWWEDIFLSIMWVVCA